MASTKLTKEANEIYNTIQILSNIAVKQWLVKVFKLLASVDLELSCLETLLSLEVKGSSEGILYDEIYIFCMGI